MADSSVSAPNPASVTTPSCSHKALRAAGISKCQSATCVGRGLLLALSRSAVRVSTKISAGAIRSISCRSREGRLLSSVVNSVSLRRPLDRDSHANPSTTPFRCCSTFSASRGRSVFSGNSSASVSVPGVTMRCTLRSTGPLLVAGSPICSQIATDSPSFTSLARY